MPINILDSEPYNTNKWNRIMLNIFWMLSVVVLISQLIIYTIVTETSPEHFTEISYIIHEIITPDAILLLLLLLLEAILRWKNEIAETAIVIGSHAMMIVILFFMNERFAVAPVLMVFPLLVATLFFRTVLLIVSLIISIAYIFYLFQYTEHTTRTGAVEFIVIGGLIIAIGITGLGVIRRGKELASVLTTTMKSEQELIIQNVLMDRMSKIDPLTELYNHKTFHEYVEMVIQYQKLNWYPLQLVILDIDNFKSVNDTFGHWVGDIALKQVAAAIRSCVSTDIFAARYGGEEFIILFREESIESAYRIVEHLRESIASTPIAEMGDQAVTISIGMHALVHGDTKASSFQKADQALYDSKNSGKNKTTIR